VNVPAEEGLTTLSEAHACFRGIERALAVDNNDDDVVAYVLKPLHFYEHAVNMVCAAAKRATPEGLVYVVHARLDVPCNTQNQNVIGVIAHGAFVGADLTDPLMPEDHATRYKTRLW